MQFPEQPEPQDPSSGSEATVHVAEPATSTETGRRISPGARAWLLDIYLAVLIVATFAVDQVSKGWVRNHLTPGSSIPAEGLFRITHTSNTGSAFGLFPNQTVLLMLASILGIGILLFFYRKQPISAAWLRTSLGLQLGGAAGNLVDRITLGEVTDFIHIGVWPIFNLADSSIVVGLAILAWFLLLSPKETRKAEGPPSPDEQEALLPSSSDDSGTEEYR